MVWERDLLSIPACTCRAFLAFVIKKFEIQKRVETFVPGHDESEDDDYMDAHIDGEGGVVHGDKEEEDRYFLVRRFSKCLWNSAIMYSTSLYFSLHCERI
jgi:hypothetical protein